jgi:DNA-binding PadR family transcriptional regulator
MARYWDQGLLSRSTGDLYNEKYYYITERGFERLDFLRVKVLEKMEDERLTEFLANIERCRVTKYDSATRTKVET